MQIHVVQSGETLWSIAQQYKIDIRQIILVNQLETPGVLVVGQSLVTPDANREYVVTPGDTLWAIANAYGVSIQDLAAVNNITDPSLIHVGQMLKMPYIFHAVQPGETLWSIAQMYGINIDLIIKANQIANPSIINVGQRLQIPIGIKPFTEVNAYATNTGEAGMREVMTLGSHFTYLSPFMYSLKTDGTISTLNDAPILKASQATNTSPLLVLTNFSEDGFDSDLTASILRNADLQETVITNILDKIRTKGYTGINVDFEYVYSEDRENYNDFLRRLVSRLHPEGYSVSTAVAPKESSDQKGLLYEAHDYAAHGEIVDFVIVMTYEWGWAGGDPWAIAPINKVRDVLDYAVTVIPRDKIVMGAPLYGRDWNIPWVQGTIASTVSPAGAVQIAAQYGANIQYDETYQSPFFRYTDETGQRHEVWFEDARSMQAKYDTVKTYNLRGVSYWVLDSPFPQNWAVLQNNFNVRKF